MSNKIKEYLLESLSVGNPIVPELKIDDIKSSLPRHINNKLLNKKREKDKIKEALKSLERCSICLEYDIYEDINKKIISCKICNSKFHLDCYEKFFNIENLEKNKISDFTCLRCVEEKKYNNEISCFLCTDHKGILKKIEKGKYVHYYCLCFIKEIDIKIQKFDVNNNRFKKCKICNLKSPFCPVIKCENKECNEKLHIKCAIEQEYIFSLPYLRNIYKKFLDKEIPFYCKKHNNIHEKYKKYLFNTYLTKKNNEKIKKKNSINCNDDKELFGSFEPDYSADTKNDCFNIDFSKLEKTQKVKKINNKEKNNISIEEDNNSFIDSINENKNFGFSFNDLCKYKVITFLFSMNRNKNFKINILYYLSYLLKFHLYIILIMKIILFQFIFIGKYLLGKYNRKFICLFVNLF